MTDVKLTPAQRRALRMVEGGACWQRRGRAVNAVRIDVLTRLMRKGLVTWENEDLPPYLTGQAFLTDAGRELLRDA